jgi:hypothetical protein
MSDFYSSTTPTKKSQNGRVNFGNTKNISFQTFQENGSISFLPFQKQAVHHVAERNSLSDLYFSEQNQQLLQNQLRYNVWIATDKKFVIDKQSPSELQLVMRSIFFQHAKNLPDHLTEQINELNSKVLEYAVEKVTSNLLQYMRYKQDISVLPTPMEHPQQACMKGSKTLMMPNFF